MFKFRVQRLSEIAGVAAFDVVWWREEEAVELVINRLRSHASSLLQIARKTEEAYALNCSSARIRSRWFQTESDESVK